MHIINHSIRKTGYDWFALKDTKDTAKAKLKFMPIRWHLPALGADVDIYTKTQTWE